MDGEQLAARMREAEARLARAIGALQQAEGSVEPVFWPRADGAARPAGKALLAEYYAAEAAAEAAYCAWRQWQRRQALHVAGPSTSPKPEQQGPDEPAASARGTGSIARARLHFTRWLYRRSHIAG